MLIRALPRDSATRRETIGEGDDWGRLEHLVATLIDVVQGWGWVQAGSNKIPRPEPIARPGDAPRTDRTQLRGKELDARLLEQRAKREREVSRARD